MSPGSPDESPAEGLIEGILQRGEQVAPPDGTPSELLTFLFADIRGYTKFTQARGDLAAALLTAKFARTVRELVDQFGGTVVELRGDEAMCVFSSPRQTLKLAVALQQRFVEETVADPNLPMAVGIGIDVGEAERGRDGYRGGVLNLAARLCSQAKAGEVLASSEAVHLARTIDGIRYVTLGRVALKGLADRVRPVRVLPEGPDPARGIAAALSAAAAPTTAQWLPAPLARRPRLTLIAAIAVAALVAGLVVALVRNPRDHALTALSENSVGIVDPQSGRLEAQVGVGAGPGAVVAGFGSVWTANADDGTVSRVDTKPLRVSQTIDVGPAPAALAVGFHSVWVVNSGSGTVSRIDPTTNSAAPPIRVGTAPRGIVVSGKSVWVTNSLAGTVSRIDPDRNETVETIPVGDGPTGISAGRDIWVANSFANTVTVIDGVTHRPKRTVPVGANPKGIAVVGDNVWVTNSVDGTVARIAATGSTVVETVLVADGAELGQLSAVGDRLWVALERAGRIAEIDQAAPHTVRQVATGPIPGAVTASGKKLWVTATTDPSAHRGGTLRIVGADIGSIDPQYNNVSIERFWLLVDNAYDGLFAFQHTNGADSASVVPDLATGKPAPTNGGRTYTFQLRSRVRWSTGDLVTPADIRRGIERSIAPGISTLAGQIVGSQDCTTRACAISGIAVDNRARTVTITLIHPNANFIDDLAVNTIAVPASTPLAEDKIHPIPTTGPYRVATYQPGKMIVLTRNPYFHEWSAAAQPNGFPDRIEWRMDPNTDSDDGVPAVNAVAADHVDWADAHAAATLDTLQARFASRLHVTLSQTIHALSLNTHLAPFNDVRVRRALAYALDRGSIARDWVSPAVVTCQVLPPNYSGYRPYCPYTLGRDDDTGVWNAPAFAKALSLVQQSHTQGMTVTVYAPKYVLPAFHHVIEALDDLHYHARLVTPPDPSHYFDFISDSRNRVQAGFFGWITGDGTAAELLDLYRCSAYTPASPNNLSPSGFCDHRVDRLIDQARVAEASSIAAASKLWAEADRRIVDEAPWIPLVTPYSVDVVSTRVHNYKRSPVLGVLLDQMWVR